ncbi:boule [Ramazzottius varieornatus]|uniref:Boule n=1 Tax=Ramazzottius varieornatus TaxID=947166 RepID=A0A1D1VAB7_RAMVA|nr:boule [Ramazzottius varieornatus]
MIGQSLFRIARRNSLPQVVTLCSALFVFLPFRFRSLGELEEGSGTRYQEAFKEHLDALLSTTMSSESSYASPRSYVAPPSSPAAYYPFATQVMTRGTMEDGLMWGTTPLQNKIFVGGLAEKTTEKDLREIFEKVMPVKEVKLITDRGQPARSGEPRRYAFIDVESPENAQKLLKEFITQDVELHGRKLTIGNAFRKQPPTGRLIAPPMFAPVMPVDASYFYAAANPWLQAQKGPMSPGGAYANPFYMAPAGYPYTTAPCVPMPAQPQSPRGGWIQDNGNVSPPTPSQSSQAQLYQLASQMIEQGYGVNSSPNQSFGIERPSSADRVSSYGQSLVQLQAGHVDQRPRSNGRGFIPVPAPVSVSRQSSISPYGQMTAPATYQASFPSSPGMYDKMV